MAKVQETRPPTTTTIRQWGYRINETGVEVWGHVDLVYPANTNDRGQVEGDARHAIAAAKRVGVEVTHTLIYRDHLTTTWSRWLPTKEA